MPRKQMLPEREVAICRRFADFRRGSKISRSLFARSIGFSPERVASYENALAPIRYEFFRALHKLFPVNPRWLVTGAGSPLAAGRFDDGPYRDQFRDEELLSVVYDRVLHEHFERLEYDVLEYLFSPNGVEERIEKILDDLCDPARKKLYSAEFQERLGIFLESAAVRFRVIFGETSILYSTGPKRPARERGLPGWPDRASK